MKQFLTKFLKQMLGGCLLLGLGGLQVIASTTVSSNITSNTTWTTSGSPYILTVPVTVAQSITLTIQPGVEVQFDNGTALYIDGTLKAVGNAASFIKFLGGGIAYQSQRGPVVFNTSSANSILQYVNIDGFGYYSYNDETPAIYIWDTTTVISNCLIQNTQGTAIKIGNKKVRVANNTFAFNTNLDVIVDPDKFKKNILINNGSIKIGLTADLDMALNDTLIGGYQFYRLLRVQTVPIAKTLLIDPGVEVQFNNGTALYVDGTLKAVGKDTSFVKFSGGGIAYQSQRGPVVFNTSSFNSILQYVKIDGFGYYSYNDETPAVYIWDTTTVISNCLIQNTQGTGMKIGNKKVRVINNTFAYNSNLDVIVDPDNFKKNILVNNGSLKIGLTADLNIALNDTLIGGHQFYRLLSSQTVPIAKTLLIDPGVEVQFNNGTALYVDGTLKAVGKDTSFIKFSGGGIAYQSQRGPVVFNPSSANSILQYVKIDGFGYYSYNDETPAIYIWDTTTVISNCLIQNTQGTGMKIGNKKVRVINNTFAYNSNLDVIVDPDNFKKNILVNNGSLKIGLTADLNIALNDTLIGGHQFYRLLSSQTVPIAKTLLIDPGVEVQFNNGTALYVLGTLKALGNSNKFINFTGGGIAYQSQRGPVYFDASSSNSLLQYVNVSGLGYYSNSVTTPAISSNSSTLTINKCIIQSTQGLGLLINGNATTNVTGTCFLNNTNGSVRVLSGKPKFYRCNFIGGNSSSASKYGIINNSTNSADTVSARECWWSSPNGPKNATSNPGGTGDSVSTKVVFSPYSTIPFNCPNSDDDLSITSILSPKVSCNLKNAENVTVVIKNNGSSVISGYTVTYQVNNNPIVRESPDTLGAGKSLTYTFATKANLSYGNGSVYNIKVYTELAADPVNNNDTAWATITNNKPFLGNDTTLLICSGSSGNLTTLYATNGYTSVIWRGGGVITRPDSVTKAGKDTLIVTNNFGCKDTAIVTVVITTGSAITSTYTTTSAGCFGNTQGSITVTPTNGKAPYWYKNGAAGAFQPANLFKNLKAGNYVVYIKDSNNCAGNTPVIAISQNPKINTTFTKTDATCIGKSDGTITVTAIGGKPPYQYRLGTSGIYKDPKKFTGLKAGIYTVYIKDVAGCTGTTSPITIGQVNVACPPRPFIADNGQDNGSSGMLLSPNPSSSGFTLQLQNDNNQPIQLRVLDVNGKTMYETKGSATQAFRFGSSFMPGVYLVEVRQGNEVKTLKAIKLK